jgi:hypothetical protein
MNSVDTIVLHLVRIHFSIVHTSKPWSSKRFFPSDISTKTIYLYLSSCLPDMCLALFVFSKLIILIEYTRRKVTKLHIMKSSPPPFTFSFLNQNVPLAPALRHPQSPSVYVLPLMHLKKFLAHTIQ